jgi:hypothetical protein
MLLATLTLALAGLPAVAAANEPPPGPVPQVRGLVPLGETAQPLAVSVPLTTPGAAPLTSFLPIELIFGVLLLLFGLGVILLQYLMFRRRPEADIEQIMKAVTLTLIIVGTLFVVVSSVQDIQISSAIGLFGTIAGYLIGKTESAASARRLTASKEGEPS